MSLKSAGIRVFLLFGCINAFEVYQAFGGQDVDLPMALFYLFSCWVLIRNFIAFTLLPVALVYLFGRASRLLLIPGFCLILIIQFGSRYTARVFHASLAEEWFPLLLNTNPREVGNFIAMAATPFVLIALALVILVAAVCCRLIWKAKYPSHTLRNAGIGLMLLLPFGVFNCLLINWHFGVAQVSYTSFFVKGMLSWQDCRGMRNACSKPKLPEKLNTAVERDILPNCVFVLGESATRNDWHLFGYPRQTTPRMDAECASNGVCFSNVLGVYPVTDRALGLLLSDVKFGSLAQGNWSISEAYKRAGYACTLIASQWNGMREFAPLSMIFNGCGRRLRVSEMAGGTGFDEDVVPLLAQVLSAERWPNLVFIHLQGMHYPVQNVIPEKERHFTDGVDAESLSGLSGESRDRINRYDDAILYEDKVLGLIVDELKKCDRPSCMFFISDHGETPRAKNWRDYTDMDTYEVPALIWFSEGYMKRFPELVERVRLAKDRPVQSDEMTDGLIELGLIKFWQEGQERRSFLSPEFCGRRPRVVNKGRIIYQERKRSL